MLGGIGGIVLLKRQGSMLSLELSWSDSAKLC